MLSPTIMASSSTMIKAVSSAQHTPVTAAAFFNSPLTPNSLSFKGTTKPLCLSLPTRNISSFKTTVSAASDQVTSSLQEAKRYHFVVANAKFMLDEEEHFKELLYERLRLFGERDREQDFWLVVEPKFLDKFPDISKRLKRPAVALVSTDATWITFMKLRLDRVLSESYEAMSLEEALAFNDITPEFEKPDNWVAPYVKYEYGWWEPFLPPHSKKSAV